MQCQEASSVESQRLKPGELLILTTTRFVDTCFASRCICATITLAMSAQIFVGGSGAVAPETAAFFDKECKSCAICETCKGFSCKVLR